MSRQSVHRFDKYTTGWHVRQPAISLYIVTYSDTEEEVLSKLLSWNLHQFPSIHLSGCTASRPYHEPGLWKEAMQQRGDGGVVGGGQTVRLAGQASAGVSLCLPCLSLSVYLQQLLACPFSQRALWKERNVILLLRRKLESVYSNQVVCGPPPTSSHFTWAERLQAPGVV